MKNDSHFTLFIILSTQSCWISITLTSFKTTNLNSIKSNLYPHVLLYRKAMNCGKFSLRKKKIQQNKKRKLTFDLNGSTRFSHFY